MSVPTKVWWQFELPSARFSPDASADNSPTRPVSSPPGGSPVLVRPVPSELVAQLRGNAAPKG
jgi:hypothetical protein